LDSIGVGGMDFETPSKNYFIAIYVIYNPTIKESGLLAVNMGYNASPEVYNGDYLPVGYTASALVSVWPTDDNGYFKIGIQNNRDVSISFINAYDSTSIPSTISALDIDSIVPPNATSIRGYMGTFNATIANCYGIAVAADENGCGSQLGASYSPAGASGSFPFEIELSQPQTIFYKNGGTPTEGVSWLISITGYSF